VAKAAKLQWSALECDVAGTLDRVDKRTQFTDFEIRAQLRVPSGTNVEHARRALERTEQACLISNSLKTRIHLHADVSVSPATTDIQADFRLSA
jgi:organic hydroperoxide reductase OsmC/OhrA